MNYFEFKYVQIILISQLTLNISLQYWLEVAWVPKFGTYPTDLYGRTSACTEVMALSALLLFLHGQVADSKFRLASGGCDQCHQHPTESNTQWDPMGQVLQHSTGKYGSSVTRLWCQHDCQATQRCQLNPSVMRPALGLKANLCCNERLHGQG